MVSKTHRLVKDRGYLILDKVSDLSFDPLYIDSKLSDLNVLCGSLNFNLTDSLGFSNSNSNVFVDEGCLIYPLRVDSYSSGMEFFPLGMKVKKSVSKFLKDEKISLNSSKLRFTSGSAFSSSLCFSSNHSSVPGSGGVQDVIRKTKINRRYFITSS